MKCQVEIYLPLKISFNFPVVCVVLRITAPSLRFNPFSLNKKRRGGAAAKALEGVVDGLKEPDRVPKRQKDVVSCGYFSLMTFPVITHERGLEKLLYMSVNQFKISCSRVNCTLSLTVLEAQMSSLGRVHSLLMLICRGGAWI